MSQSLKDIFSFCGEMPFNCLAIKINTSEFFIKTQILYKHYAYFDQLNLEQFHRK